MKKSNKYLVKIILILGVFYIITDTMKALLDNERIGNLFGLLLLPLFFYLFHKYFVTYSIEITFFKSVVLALIIMVITGLIHTVFNLIFFSDIIGKEAAYQMMLDDLYSGIAFGVIYYVFYFLRKLLKSRTKKQA